MLSSKGKLINETFIDKCKAIKDLEQRMSNKDVVNKYGVPRKTISILFKTK